MDVLPDRFDPGKFENDEPVTLRLASGEAPASVGIAEGIFERLHLLARAYRLHVLADVFEPHSLTTLIGTQSDGLLRELACLAGVVRDPVVIAAISQLQPIVAKSARADDPLIVDWDI